MNRRLNLPVMLLAWDGWVRFYEFSAERGVDWGSIFFLLDRYVERKGRDPAMYYNGLDVVLVGRSNNVGKPALWLALARGATVTAG
jgi:hypothetical protein